MQIANPIYDSVFKYLLDDLRVAKIFISALIGQEVLELSMAPTETKVKLPIEEQNPQRQETIQTFLTVLRVDFAARVRTEEGARLILIEILKAKLPGDIMRFRRYLGHNYMNPANVVVENRESKPLPLQTIYFLGHSLALHKDYPVIRIDRRYTDAATNTVLEGKEEFIEGLTHDSIVVQIPAINNLTRRTNLERMLQLFDQAQIQNNRHTLNVVEHEIPETFQPIYRRLLEAIAEEEIQNAMNVEDEVLEEFRRLEQKYDIQLEAAKEAVSEAQRQKEEAQAKEQEAQAKEQEAQRQKDETQQLLYDLVRKMKLAGQSIDDIVKLSNLDRDIVERL